VSNDSGKQVSTPLGLYVVGIRADQIDHFSTCLTAMTAALVMMMQIARPNQTMQKHTTADKTSSTRKGFILSLSVS
jgi:hypothetical protein